MGQQIATPKLLRKGAGITQESAAQSLGVDRATLSRYENGKAIPSFNLFRHMRRLYRVEVDELFAAFERVIKLRERRMKRNGRRRIA